MKLSTFSMFVVSILTFSNVSVVVNGQIRRRHGHARLLEEIAWDPQESVLHEEPALLMEDVSISQNDWCMAHVCVLFRRLSSLSHDECLIN